MFPGVVVGPLGLFVVGSALADGSVLTVGSALAVDSVLAVGLELESVPSSAAPVGEPLVMVSDVDEAVIIELSPHAAARIKMLVISLLVFMDITLPR